MTFERLEGFRYQPDLIGLSDETALVARVRELSFKEFEFHGYLGKRRVVSFGWQYDYSGQTLRKADDIPEFLLPLRELAASFAGFEPGALQHVLVTEYGPGAGIGWHRDKKVFGQVVGISLLTPCTLRFRRQVNQVSRSHGIRSHGTARQGTGSGSDRMLATPQSKPPKAKRQWERVNVLAEPRSAYHLSGPARLEWEHSISHVDELRYSITFRNMREN